MAAKTGTPTLDASMITPEMPFHKQWVIMDPRLLKHVNEGTIPTDVTGLPLDAPDVSTDDKRNFVQWLIAYISDPSTIAYAMAEPQALGLVEELMKRALSERAIGAYIGTEHLSVMANYVVDAFCAGGDLHLVSGGSPLRTLIELGGFDPNCAFTVAGRISDIADRFLVPDNSGRAYGYGYPHIPRMLIDPSGPYSQYLTDFQRSQLMIMVMFVHDAPSA